MRVLIVLALCSLLAVSAQAQTLCGNHGHKPEQPKPMAVSIEQDYTPMMGIMQSAETVDKGLFKLAAYPIYTYDSDAMTEGSFDGVARLGYGLAKFVDVEMKVGVFANAMVLGADVEFWVIQEAIDVSLTGGYHYGFGRKGHSDTRGLELAPTVSGNIADRLELCGTVATSLETPLDGSKDLWTVYAVPGFEFKAYQWLDLEAEAGFDLNDNALPYVSVGASMYF